MCYNGSMDRKEYMRKYQRKWMARRRKEFFDDKSCIECGATENLELDHIDPSEKISHKIWSWAESKRLSEIAKCQVLCGECHKKKTKEWYRQNRKHGRTMYAYGCKCEICVEAQRLHNAQRYASKALR